MTRALVTLYVEPLANPETRECLVYAPLLKHALLETYITFERRLMGPGWYTTTEWEEYVASVMESLPGFDQLSDLIREQLLWCGVALMQWFVEQLETLEIGHLNLLEILPQSPHAPYVALIV